MSTDEHRSIHLSGRSDLTGNTPPGEAVIVAQQDMTDSDRVRELFDRCRSSICRGARRVVIDLRAVESADTKLLACVVALYQVAQSHSARLELCLSRAVREVARVCRLEWLTDQIGVA